MKIIPSRIYNIIPSQCTLEDHFPFALWWDMLVPSRANLRMFVHQLMANLLVWVWDSPFSNNPFHRGILGMQTTGIPNQQLTISWVVQQIQKMTKTSLDFAKGLLPEDGSLVISCGYLPKRSPNRWAIRPWFLSTSEWALWWCRPNITPTSGKTQINSTHKELTPFVNLAIPQHEHAGSCGCFAILAHSTPVSYIKQPLQLHYGWSIGRYQTPFGPKLPSSGKDGVSQAPFFQG